LSRSRSGWSRSARFCFVTVLAPPSEVFSRILAVLHDRLTMPIVIDTLNRGVLEARKSAEKGTRSLTDNIKDIFK